MNERFDFNRFKKVVAMDARGMWPRFGLTMLILALVPMALWLFLIVLGKHAPDAMAPEVRWFIILGLTGLVAILAPSRMYKSANLPKKGIYYAMLPASKSEKFLSMCLYCFIICPVVFILGSVAIDTFLRILPIGCYQQWLFAASPWMSVNWDNIIDSLYDPFRLGVVFKPGLIMVSLILTYIAYVATFLFTNTIFKRHKVIMTVLWLWLIGFALQLVLTPVSMALIPNLDMDSFVEHLDALRTINCLYWVEILTTLIWDVVFIWWTACRLKNMRY